MCIKHLELIIFKIFFYRIVYVVYFLLTLIILGVSIAKICRIQIEEMEGKLTFSLKIISFIKFIKN